MKTILGFKIPSKKTLTSDDFIKAAEACGQSKLIGMKLHEALLNYAHELFTSGKIHARDMPITQAFLCKIPDDQIESIKGIKATGHKIINYLKTQ